MPRIFHSSSEMEGFYGVLYELVCPMLASDSCVKCITEDGSTTFTSDPEHLLRNVDIEHPAGELVLRALQSHKHTFGTGTKTLLFMLASLAKAVVQLSKLGIHSDDSLDVIRDVFTDLTKEVQEISVDTTECFTTFKQENFRRDINNCEASENAMSDRTIIACDETEAALQQDIETQGLLNIHNNKVHTFNGSRVGKEHCLLREEYALIAHSDLSQLNADSLPELYHKPSTASCMINEFNSSVAKLELDSITCCESGMVVSSCSAKEITVMNVTEMSDYVVEGNSDGEIQDTQCASTNPVHLKMSDLQNVSGDTDDTDWFFDFPSYPGCAEVNTSLTDAHMSQDKTESSNLPLNCFVCPGHQDYKTCSLDSTEHEIQQNSFNINSSFHNLKDLVSSQLQNTDCKNHENKLITDDGIYSLKDDDQYSSDFMNCFHEWDKRLPFEFANSMSSEELDIKTNVSTMKSCLVSNHNYVGSQLFTNLQHKTFKESNILLADNQVPERYDEFDACFSDIDVQDSSVTCENTVVKHVDDSLFPTSHHMADSQLTEKYEDDEFDACFADVYVQDSSVTCGNAVIKHVNNSEFSSSYHMADNQLPEKYDEFDACFRDIDVQDSSVTCENTVVKHVDDSVFPSSHHMADSQLTEKDDDDDDDDEFDTCFNDTDDQHSSVTCENSDIKQMGGYEYPLLCQTMEIGNNIKQKHLFPKASRALCGVIVTNNMSGKDLKDTIRTSSVGSSDNVKQKSEIEKLNAMLEFFKDKKTNVSLPKLSRHLDHFQSKQNLQHGGPESIASAIIIDNSSSSSKHLIESTLCQGYLKDTFQDGVNLSADISIYDTKNLLQAQENYFTSIENDPFRCSSQEDYEENNSSHQRETALCTGEVHNDNKHKPNSWNKDSQVLLAQLLQKKKASFRSTITEKVMLSSRHFSKDSADNKSCSSLLHEDSGLLECTPNEGNRYFSYSKHVVTQNLSKGYLTCERKPEFDNVKDCTSLTQNESVTVSESSDPGLGVCTHFQDQHVETHTHPCSEASNINCLQDSACCHPTEILCNSSGEPKELNRANQPQDIVDFLHDCKNDVGDVAKYIFHNQIKDKEDVRFNFHLVNCLLLPSLISLPEPFKSSWRSSASPVSVTPGLVIPCDSHILEKLHLNEQSLLALIIGGDLTPNFHHKGYVPTLPKKTLIAKLFDGKEESHERMWCTDVLDILKKLNVKLLLVKGKASSVLLDMCEGAGVLLLTNISYHTLSVLSHLHRVDIVTYVALATEENLCTVCLQPLSTTWMDHLQDTQLNSVSQFAVITRTPDVQTAIIHCSNTMSAQLLEERLWKCLHGIANLQTDAKVLPGQGKTEIWCAKRIHYRSGCMLGNQSMVHSVILEAVANIFQEYHQRVMLNTKFYVEEHIQRRNDTEINSVSRQCGNYVGSPEHNCFSKTCHLPFDSQTSNYGFRTITGNHMKQSVKKEVNIFKLPESSVFKLKTSSRNTISDNSSESPNSSNFSSANNYYDNFKSKVSAWKTAVDVVSVLQNLGSLVISGIDTVDINESMSLL